MWWLFVDRSARELWKHCCIENLKLEYILKISGWFSSQYFWLSPYDLRFVGNCLFVDRSACELWKHCCIENLNFLFKLKYLDVCLPKVSGYWHWHWLEISILQPSGACGQCWCAFLCVCASTFHLTSVLKCTKPLTFFIHLTFSLFYKSTS